MTEYIQTLLQRFIVDKDQQQYRIPFTDDGSPAAAWKEESLNDLQRSVRRLQFMLEKEIPHVYPDERIALIRTVPRIPEIFTAEEREELQKKHYIHEQGKVCNINPEYIRLIEPGFDRKRDEIRAELDHGCTSEKREYLNALLSVLDLIESFARRYRDAAEKAGNKTVAETFSRIPSAPPRTYLEALQFLRLLHLPNHPYRYCQSIQLMLQ